MVALEGLIGLAAGEPGADQVGIGVECRRWQVVPGATAREPDGVADPGDAVNVDDGFQAEAFGELDTALNIIDGPARDAGGAELGEPLLG